jgi:hypothetical protein
LTDSDGSILFFDEKDGGGSGGFRGTQKADVKIFFQPLLQCEKLITAAAVKRTEGRFEAREKVDLMIIRPMRRKFLRGGCLEGVEEVVILFRYHPGKVLFG